MGERIQPGKGHIPYGQEYVSFVYQPATTEKPQGIVVLTAGLGDEASEFDKDIPIFTANGFSTIKVAGPHGNGTPRLPNRRIADIPERSVNAIWMAYDHVFARTAEREAQIPTVIYGPSMGGRTALLAAKRRVQDVSGVVLANPAYCPPGSNLFDRTRRFFGSGIDSFKTGSVEFKKGSIETVKRLASSPVASFRLGATALEQDLPEIVFELAEKNVKTVFILGEKDPVFDPAETSTSFLTHFHTRYAERVKQSIQTRSLEHMVPQVHIVPGGHYLEDYALLGLKGIQAALGNEHQKYREEVPSVTLFDATREG